MKDVKDFNNLSSSSSYGTYYIICTCGKKIYLARTQHKTIKCFKCKALWKLNHKEQFAHGTGDNKGVQIFFGKK